MESSYYLVSCACGKEIKTASTMTECCRCHRRIYIAWNDDQAQALFSKQEFRAWLRSRPTPREDPTVRRERLEVMRIKGEMYRERKKAVGC